jgi:hypothetical protein
MFNIPKLRPSNIEALAAKLRDQRLREKEFALKSQMFNQQRMNVLQKQADERKAQWQKNLMTRPSQQTKLVMMDAFRNLGYTPSVVQAIPRPYLGAISQFKIPANKWFGLTAEQKRTMLDRFYGEQGTPQDTAAEELQAGGPPSSSPPSSSPPSSSPPSSSPTSERDLATRSSVFRRLNNSGIRNVVNRLQTMKAFRNDIDRLIHYGNMFIPKYSGVKGMARRERDLIRAHMTGKSTPELNAYNAYVTLRGAALGKLKTIDEAGGTDIVFKELSKSIPESPQHLGGEQFSYLMNAVKDSIAANRDDLIGTTGVDRKDVMNVLNLGQQKQGTPPSDDSSIPDVTGNVSSIPVPDVPKNALTVDQEGVPLNNDVGNVPAHNIGTPQNILAGVANPYISLINLAKGAVMPRNVPNIPQIPHDNAWSYLLSNIASSLIPFGAAYRGISSLGRGAEALFPFLKKTPGLIKNIAKSATASGATEYGTAADDQNRGAAGIQGSLIGAGLGGIGYGASSALKRLAKTYVDTMPFVHDVIDKVLGKNHNLPSRQTAQANLADNLVDEFNLNKNQSKNLYNAAFKSIPEGVNMKKSDISNLLETLEESGMNDNQIDKMLKDAKIGDGPEYDPQKLKFWASEFYHKGNRNFAKGIDTNYDYRAIHRAANKDINAFLKKKGDLKAYNEATEHYVDKIAPFRNNKNFVRLERELIKRGSKYFLDPTVDISKILNSFKSTPADTSLSKFNALSRLLGEEKAAKTYQDVMLSDYVGEDGKIDIQNLMKRISNLTTREQRTAMFKDFDVKNIEAAVKSYNDQMRKRPSGAFAKLSSKFSPKILAIEFLSALLAPLGKVLHNVPRSIKKPIRLLAKGLPMATVKTLEAGDE